MWAKWISGVFHPLVMPLATLVLVFALDPCLQALPEVFMYMGIVVLVNTLAPAVSIWVLHRRGYLSDLDIHSLYGFIESTVKPLLTKISFKPTLQDQSVTFDTSKVLKVPRRVYQWVPYTKRTPS